MTEEKRRPWLRFYPSDWRSDPRLRMCSLSARGLWIDLISIMHEAEPYGHLVIGGTVPKLPEIAVLVGRPVKDVATALSELTAFGVCSLGDNGEVFSRRMVRDRQREVALVIQGKRGGNPNLIRRNRGEENPPVNPRPNQPKPPLKSNEKSLNPDVHEPLKPHGTTISNSREGSVAIATADDPALDPAKLMFASGKALLGKAGHPPDRAGKILGKWRKDFGDAALIAAIGAAVREDAQDPVEFIAGCLRRSANDKLGRPVRDGGKDAALTAIFGMLDRPDGGPVGAGGEHPGAHRGDGQNGLARLGKRDGAGDFD